MLLQQFIKKTADIILLPSPQLGVKNTYWLFRSNEDVSDARRECVEAEVDGLPEPVQFQQPVPKRKWTGQVALVAWAVFHIVLYSRSSWSTCIPKYPPQDGLPQLSSDAVIANDRDSTWTLNYSRYFLLRESLLFGRP